MEIFILLGSLVILAGIRYELRAWRTVRRRRRLLAARASARAVAAPLAVAVLFALLAGCGRKDVKPNLPGAGTVVAPKVVYVDRYVYVRIKSELTQAEPIAEGPLSQCPAVAADRRAGLERANAKLRQIGQIQGTEAQP